MKLFSKHAVRTVIVAVVIVAAVIGVALVPLPFESSTRILNSVFIARPPDAVFAYVTTPGNWPKWHPSSLSVRGATDHSLALGERVTEDFLVAGRKGQAVWTVVESSSPQSWAIDGTINGRDAGSVHYILSSEAGGTRFNREFIYGAPNLLFVLVNRLSVRAQIEEESEQAVQQLKRVLESAP